MRELGGFGTRLRRSTSCCARLLRFLGIVRAEFDEKEAATFGNQLDIGRAAFFERFDDAAFHALEADGLQIENFHDVIGGFEGVFVADADQRAVLRTVNEADLRFENYGAGAFGANQRARHVKITLGQKLVEVVAGNAARNLRELGANQRFVLIANGAQLGVDFGRAPAGVNDLREFGIGGGADGHLRAVGKNDAQLFNVVDGFPAEQRMRAAGIVAGHAADGAAAMRRRIGSKGEVMLFGLRAQNIQNHAGLDAREAALRIDFENAIHVLGEIEDDSNVAGLPGKAGASAARQNGGAELFAGSDGGDYVGIVTRDDQTDGHLAVIRAVGGVYGPAGAVETHFAANGAAQFCFELRCPSEGIKWFSVRTKRQGLR